MKLTNRSEYALLALIYLARNQGELCHASDIALKQGIPTGFLQQILFTLKRANIVKSIKGKNGGYALSKAPDKISIAEIVRLFEGAIAPISSASKHFYEPTPSEKERKLLGLMKEIRTLISDKLEKTTLSNLI